MTCFAFALFAGTKRAREIEKEREREGGGGREGEEERGEDRHS